MTQTPTQHNTTLPHAQDGIHGLVAREKMSSAAQKRRDTYNKVPGAPLLKQEFGYYCLEQWQAQGMPADADLKTLFQYDESGDYSFKNLGWCEASFYPQFDIKIIEDRGETEIEQDFAGRHVLYFKGKRHGFMPEYMSHPVKDLKSWEEHVKWRMDPNTAQRYVDIQKVIPDAIRAAGRGEMICENLIGGFMYLRSLIGPEELLYAVYDQPQLIHDCMETWFNLADRIIAEHQKYVTLDEIFFAEDICYNHGPLIAPDMMREFLLPYYQQLIRNLKLRQLDPSRHLFVQIDTDGDCRPVIRVYMESIGMEAMSPFEVASGCDVLEIARDYPDLILRGGIDKRVLAQDPKAIDAMVERILPPLRARGGYIPCCDHGVPAEVSYQNYLHYRKRCVELGE